MCVPASLANLLQEGGPEAGAQPACCPRWVSPLRDSSPDFRRCLLHTFREMKKPSIIGIRTPLQRVL